MSQNFFFLSKILTLLSQQSPVSMDYFTVCSLVSQFSWSIYYLCFLASLPRMHWAEAGLRDDVAQVGVRMFSVGEVQLSLSDVNNLRLLHGQRANAA